MDRALRARATKSAGFWLMLKGLHMTNAHGTLTATAFVTKDGVPVDQTADGLKWHATARVDKFSPEHVHLAAMAFGVAQPSLDMLLSLGGPEEVVIREHNLVTTAGLGRITNLILGLGGQAASGSTTTRLGVGDGTTAAARADTDLGAASGSGNRYFQPVSSAAQSTTTYTNDTMTFVATFASANGNFAWNEWGTDISAATVSGGTTVGTLFLNHAVPAGGLGTKASGASWTLTATIQLS